MNRKLIVLWGVAACCGSLAGGEEPAPSFTRDVRPLLARKCFACHGPDEEAREADLRLDRREVAVDYGAIVPGEPDDSTLVHRIAADDPDVRMPPAEGGESLTDAQQQMLRRWIADGARYQRHWAFVPPERPALPQVQRADWPRNGIDHFVLARLEAEGMEPSPRADRYRLVRRVYLDLIGLPPTPEEADAFVQNEDPQAYEKLVDRLLQSQRYGEHWARQWLDLARYADTNGYEKDRPRSIWPYRDWVIRALNDDMPFDQFTIEQLAGDMLPDASPQQRIATGFHRNTMLNEEGGIDPLEFRFYAMVDRVATTGTVWLGMTTGCAQCHSHKYDPVSHTEYYRLMALLNNADEPDMEVPDPKLIARRQELKARIDALEQELPNHFPPLSGEGAKNVPEQESRQKHYEQQLAKWIEKQAPQARNWITLRPTELRSNLPKLEVLDDGSIFSSGDITKRDVFTLKIPIDETKLPLTALRLEVLPDKRLPAGGPGRAFYEGRKGDFFLSELTAELDGKPRRFASASHSYGKISIGSGNARAENVFDGEGSTGWSTAGAEGEVNQLVLNFQKPLNNAGELTVTLVFERHFAASLGRFRLGATSHPDGAKATTMPVEVEDVLARDRATWSKTERATVRRHFNRVAPQLADARKSIDRLRKQMPSLPMTMVMQERPADNPRPTYRHHRGEYLSPRQQVTPGVPAVLLTEGQQQPANRLELARWLVSGDNPLTARVTANRAWQAFFGKGIVATSGDFGTQADAPSHPELLDWLACEFVAKGWSLKELHRLIVTSATYRQASRITPELQRRDPGNRLLARGPRYRLHAETLRDSMLKSSGLLSTKMYGPGVYPPQPASVTELAYGNTKWNVSTGEDRYRRSIYTFKKRTAPFAAYTVFDAPSGERCIARRNRSNTPLQALTLLNDEMYLEMARALADLAMQQEVSGERDRVAFIFRRVLTRPPEDEEVDALTAYFQRQLARLQAGELKAGQIAAKKNAKPDFAAWVLLARVVMNLDEAIVKP